MQLLCIYVVQESKEATNYYFCYRWLLILFKREFSSYEEVRPLCPLWPIAAGRSCAAVQRASPNIRQHVMKQGSSL